MNRWMWIWISHRLVLVCVYFYHRIKVISKIARGEDWSKSLSNYTSDAGQSNLSSKICILQVQFWLPLRSDRFVQTLSFSWMNLLITFVRTMHMKLLNANAVHHMVSEKKKQKSLGGNRRDKSALTNAHSGNTLRRQCIVLSSCSLLASCFYYISQLINERCRQLIINSIEIVKPLRVHFCSI